MTTRRSNVLLVAYYYPPQVAAGALRPARFARYLDEYDYQAHVLTLQTPGDKSGASVERVSPQTEGLFAAQGATFFRGVQKLLNRRSYRLEWVPAALRAAKRMADRTRFDAVISTGPPQAAHIVGALLKRQLGIPWIADFRDPIVSPVSPASRADYWLERRFFDEADMIVAVTDRVKDGWQEQYPEYGKKFRLLWNGFDPAEPFGAVPRPERPHRLISHIGDLYGPRHPGRMLASLNRLMNESGLHSDLQVDLIGPMDADSPCLATPAFDQLVRRGALRFNAAIIPREQALRATAESDYLLLLDINPQGIGYTVPAKLFDYIRSGRPILAYTGSESPVQQILRNSGVRHACVHPTDNDHVEDQKLAEFLESPAGITEPNEWFWRTFDGRRQTETLAGFLDEVTSRQVPVLA